MTGEPNWGSIDMGDIERIRVIVYRDADLWVAQALEYDIGAQADDPETLVTRLEVTMRAEIEMSVKLHGKPLAGIEPAPQHFHDKWDDCGEEFTPVRKPSMPLEMALCA